MDLDKHKLLLWGTLILFFGIQFHYFNSYVLTEKASKVYYSRFEKKAKVDVPKSKFLQKEEEESPRKTFRPPNWLGRCLISVGAVLVVQAIMLRKKQ